MPYGSFGNLVFEVVEYFSHTEEHPYIYARKDTIYPPLLLNGSEENYRKLL